MKLDLAYYHISDVQFGKKTEIRDKVLYIDRNELRSYLLSDKNFSDIKIEIAHPGEMTRIINILDIVDPRKKQSEESEVFPGFIGKLGTVGSGRTNILKNVSIIETGHMKGFFGGILDMGGNGSLYSPYSKNHNIVLIPTASNGVDAITYSKSLKTASLKTSVYLGKASLYLTTDEVRTIDFTLCGRRNTGLEKPRIGYIWQVLSHYELRAIYYYGAKSISFYPLFISPNEIFDGAVVTGHYDHSPPLKNYTYSILNHPIAMELCRRHGEELDFAGIIFTNEPKTVREKKWNALLNAQIAKSVLDLDGVIITKEGGGHADLDLMETCKQCENLGIKTAMIDLEMLSPEGIDDYPLVVFEPEADAIVSIANFEERISISKMDKVIGGKKMNELGEDLKGEKKVPLWLLSGAMSEIGMCKLKGELF